MRWSIIRLIWLRELRDQLRDRRTLFMVAVLPLLLYPVLGYAVIQFALGFSEKPSLIGIAALSDAPLASISFPDRIPPGAGSHAAPYVAWLGTGAPGNILSATSLSSAGLRQFQYPYLIRDGRFTTFDSRLPQEQAHLLITQAKLRIVPLREPAGEALAHKRVDLVLEAAPDFYTRLEMGEEVRLTPVLTMHLRPGDERSIQAQSRLGPLLDAWKRDLQTIRIARKGLPSTFDEPFAVHEIGKSRSASQSEGIFDLMIRVFPFMLVMWSLAGALYPAVDLCAGEKERGTMETLLITPAGREEIVLGKFLTIWVFSAASAVLNVLSMGLATWKFGAQFGQGSMPIGALLWSIVLSLPLSALFSAVSLAIGAYARSSKEGQYYLMPLFLVTMPLIFLTLAPGVELGPFYSLVPVTGVALLMQRLMAATTLDQVPWLYFIPVLLPVAIYSWLALKWAIGQFQREEVLFREAERLDVRLWLKNLFREKEPTPTAGQAFFLFGLVVGLRWLAMGIGSGLPLTVHTAVSLLALVALPVIIMGLLLHTKPRASFALNWPTWRELGLGAVLAVLLLPPMAAVTTAVFRYFPHLTQLLEDRQPLVQELRLLQEGGASHEDHLLPYLLVFALLPALCEEIAFRGYILSGLLRKFRAGTAILLSSFLFALFHMNVFQFVPSFLMGLVLGLLTVRSKSLLPAVLFHFLHNGVLLVSTYVAREVQESVPQLLVKFLPHLIAISMLGAIALLWWLYRRPYVALERALGKNATSPAQSA